MHFNGKQRFNLNGVIPQQFNSVKLIEITGNAETTGIIHYLGHSYAAFLWTTNTNREKLQSNTISKLLLFRISPSAV